MFPDPNLSCGFKVLEAHSAMVLTSLTSLTVFEMSTTTTSTTSSPM